MGHNASRWKTKRIEDELQAVFDRRSAVADAIERDRCAPIVRDFNAELAEGRLPRFSPSIRTAIAAGAPVLEFYCPGCWVVGEVDLRQIDQHPETPVVGLIPRLSCRRCCPNSPFARLNVLRAATAYETASVKVALVPKATPSEKPRAAARARPRLKVPAEPPPTIIEMQKADTKWCWVYCGNNLCGHSAAVAYAPLIIRWGATATADTMRRCFSCSKCGHKGASLCRASFVNTQVGFQPYPPGRGGAFAS